MNRISPLPLHDDRSFDSVSHGQYYHDTEYGNLRARPLPDITSTRSLDVTGLDGPTSPQPSYHPPPPPLVVYKKESPKARRKRCFTMLKAVMTRTMFFVHALVAVWRAAEVAGALWWALLGALVLLAIESGITVGLREGKEWKIFCPSVFLFLVASVPAIWLMELNRFSRHNAALNMTLSTVSDKSGSGLALQIPVYIGQDTWIMAIEQSLMIILIIGRWLLPKGSMSRQELSSLLLVYVGLAADIIDLFDIFKSKNVLKNFYFIYAVLGVWSLSLMQFVFVISGSSADKKNSKKKKKQKDLQMQPNLESDDESDPSRQNPCRQVCCSWETWGIVWSLGMQDCPFLAVRLTAIILFNINNYSHFFFTAKNTLVILLQTYRLFAVTCCNEEPEDDEDEADVMT